MLNIVATVLALLACSAVCQDVGFALDGAIESATATDSSFNTGGYISVNGWKVLVPQNLQVGFPAAWIPWKDFVAAWNTAIFKEFEVSVSLGATKTCSLRTVTNSPHRSLEM